MEIDENNFKAFRDTTKEEKLPPERAALHRMAQDNDCYKHDEVFWLILRWGGIRARNAKRLVGDSDAIKVFTELREQNIDRFAAFDAFNKLPSNGLGISFFTKLIFFASKPFEKGYILDQWTSKAVNQLYSCAERPSRNVIPMKGDYPCPNNTSDTYRDFCNCVETVAGMLDECDPELAEFRLFKWPERPKKARTEV